MKTTIRLLALIVALGAAGWWLAAGANRGWTKTSIPKTTIDEVTGIEAITYLLQRMTQMEEELQVLKARLRLYEEDDAE